MKIYSGISYAALAVASLIATPTLAAAPAAPSEAPADAPGDETIIVTGTRTTGLRASDSPAPIQVLGSDVLKRVGQPDLIQSLAQNLPSIQAQAFGSDQSAHHLSFKLRGVSPNHALVLINGKRRHGTASVVVSGGAFGGNASADIGLIPTASIDHIEVLQDGAAAQYGTDAIAGVINLFLKKADHGGEVTATAGKYFDEGGETYDLMGNIGIEPFEGAYLNISAEQKYHGFSFRGDVDPRVINTGFANSSGVTLLRNFPNLVNAPNYPYVNRISGDARYQQTTVTYNAGYEFSDSLEFYSFGTFATKSARAYENYRLPNVVVGKAATDIAFPLGFAPQEYTKEQDYGVTAGLSGNFGGTTFDLSSTYGKDVHDIFVDYSANSSLYNDTSTLTQRGFTPNLFYDGTFFASQWTNTLDLTHQFDIGLSEPVTLAGGVEYRRETYGIKAGDPASYYKTGAQSFFGYSPVNASNNHRSDISEYLDISLKPLPELLIDAAVRHEDYSDFGSTTVVKLTGRYDFSEAFALRGTASTGFRAPTLAEEFYSGINVGPTSVSGVFAPNSSGASFLGIGGLGPEKSTNFSAGVVLKPVSRLTVTIDLYSIKINDRIVQSGTFFGYNSNTSVIRSASVLQALAANGVVIDPTIFTATSGSVGVQTFVNGIDTLTQGVDFVATYSTDLDNLGRVDWSLTGNYNTTKIKNIAAPPSNVNQNVLLLDIPAQTTLTKTTPKFRATAGAVWTWGKLGVNVRESYYSKSYAFAQDPILAQLDKIKVNTKFITDLDISYQLLGPVRLSVGANNLFNVYPTKNPAIYRDGQFRSNASGYATKYPSFSPIGINGGFYYAKATLTF